MLPNEKEKLLALLGDEGQWCREAEARDRHGDAVRYDDVTAVSWDLTGAICLLFGWRRACELFPQLDRHIIGGKRGPGHRQNPEIDAMVALQDFNDLLETTYDGLVAQLRSMPVRRGNRSYVE
jgi:hypothetical protein